MPVRSSWYPLTILFTIPLTLSGQRAFRPDTVALQRLLVAEDARGNGVDGITPLLEGLQGRDTMLRRVAVRGLGRLQRPELVGSLLPLLNDSALGVRIEAANALAQSLVRIRRRAGDSGQAIVRSTATAFIASLAIEKQRDAIGALSDGLGRLPYGDTTDAHRAERAIVAAAASHPDAGEINGLYWLANSRRSNGMLSSAAIAVLRRAARPPADTLERRVALLALGLMNGLDSATTVAASHDRDEQARRLALANVRGLPATARRDLLRRAVADVSPLVRIAAIAAVRAETPAPDCVPIVRAASDRNEYVALTAIDALGFSCADPAAAASVLDQIVQPHTWRSSQVQAHALASLARIDRGAATRAMPRYVQSPMTIERKYAARAAATIRDTISLRLLASDIDHNVQAEAIFGLMRTVSHDADAVYFGALNSSAYQVVLAADSALIGSPYPGLLSALLDAFDRLSAGRSENARDPRIATLKRISESGSRLNADRLQPYLSDFDTTITANVAAILSRWTGIEIAARPKPLPISVEPLAAFFLARDIRLRVTMAEGETFVVRLLADEAPATAARIVRLVRRHFYDGHVFQRVEPDFVVQGGGPDASEYVGDSTFMRDEVGRHSNLRGTLGISARGRDTGDGQWFLNLVDNTRLDHDYTVFGEVVAGLNVADRIREGATIARVEVISRR